MHLTGELFGLVQGLLQVAGEVHLPGAAAGNLGQALHRGGELLPQGGRLHTGLLHQLGDEPLFLLQQGKQQVLLLDLLILPAEAICWAACTASTLFWVNWLRFIH